MAEQETVYCANCETEATHLSPNGAPLCTTCAEAYKWGQATPNGAVDVLPTDEDEA